MQELEANKAIVRSFFGAIEDGNLALIERLQAPDCHWWVIGRGELSRQAFTDDIKAMLLSAERRQVEIIGMVAQGDRVACEIRSEIHFGERVYRNEYHDLLVLRDGLIVQGREYLDTARVAAFFGSAPDAERIVPG